MKYKRFRKTNYEVSSCGQIRTIPHVKIKSNGIKHTVKQTLLRPAIDNKGYYRVGLSVNGKLSTFKVHRIVAEVYVPGMKEGLQVNHIDGNKLNNNADNLEWVTNRQNIVHAYSNGLTKGTTGKRKNTENFKRGKENHATKLTEKDVILARTMRNRDNISLQSIADYFGVNRKTITHAIKGITFSYVKQK